MTTRLSRKPASTPPRHAPARRVRPVLAVLAASALAGCGQVESGSERQKIDIGEGLFQLAPDPAVGTETPAWLHGGIEWEYVGQAIYTGLESRDRVPSWHEDATDADSPTDTVTRLLGTTMEDEHGRQFRPRAVDVERLREAVRAYDDATRQRSGEEPAGDRGSEPDGGEGVGRSVTRTPLVWNDTSTKFVWDTEDRQIVFEPLTEPEEKTVLLLIGDVGSDARSCTGTLIGDDWVLTAAHCVQNSTGTAWIYSEDSQASGPSESRRGKVCTQGNVYSGRACANVTARWGTGDYTGDGDFGDDLVVMKIDQPLGEGHSMALSRAGDDTLRAFSQYNVGHPGTTPSGTSNVWCNTQGTGDPYGGYASDPYAPCASYQYWASGALTYTSTKVMGTRIDVSTGHSGGPIYYYPDSASPSHFLTGVMAGSSEGDGPERYNGGPKVPYHRDWIIGIMSAN